MEVSAALSALDAAPVLAQRRGDLALLVRRSLARRVLLHVLAWVLTTGILTLMVDAAAGHRQTPERLLRIALQVGLMLAPPVYLVAWLVDLRSRPLALRIALGAAFVALWPVLCDPIQRRFGTGAPVYALIVTSGMLVMTVLAIRGAIRGLRAESQLPLAQQLRLAAERRLVGAELAPHTLHDMLLTLHQVAATTPTRAGSFILDLSMMMRHLVEGTRREFVAAGEEWAFVEAYARFCEERGGVRAQLDLEVEGDEDTRVPALLVVTLLTNAVRLAADEQGHFRVRLSLLLLESGFRLRVAHVPRPVEGTPDDDSDVGLALMRRRLDELYPNANRLARHARDEWHEVDIETW
jgi:hypothetical protein